MTKIESYKGNLFRLTIFSMTDLVPYLNASSNLASEYLKYNPRLRTARFAGKSLKFAYDHRKEAASAARTIKRAFKRYQARSKPPASRFERIGETPGSGTTKRQNVGNTEVANRTDRTLYQQDLTDIPGTTSGVPQIDERRRALLNYRGVKVCMEWKNNLSVDLLCNIAIIAPRAGTSVPTTDFFRGNGNVRAIDFNVFSLNSMDIHCRPINADKYTVLKHMKFQLGATGTGTLPRAYKFVEFYQAINRQLRYDDEDGGSAKTPFFLVYWAAPVLTTTTDPTNASAYTVTYDTVAYYREPSACMC